MGNKISSIYHHKTAKANSNVSASPLRKYNIVSASLSSNTETEKVETGEIVRDATQNSCRDSILIPIKENTEDRSTAIDSQHIVKDISDNNKTAKNVVDNTVKPIVNNSTKNTITCNKIICENQHVNNHKKNISSILVNKKNKAQYLKSINANNNNDIKKNKNDIIDKKVNNSFSDKYSICNSNNEVHNNVIFNSADDNNKNSKKVIQRSDDIIKSNDLRADFVTNEENSDQNKESHDKNITNVEGISECKQDLEDYSIQENRITNDTKTLADISNNLQQQDDNIIVNKEAVCTEENIGVQDMNNTNVDLIADFKKHHSDCLEQQGKTNIDGNNTFTIINNPSNTNNSSIDPNKTFTYSKQNDALQDINNTHAENNDVYITKTVSNHKFNDNSTNSAQENSTIPQCKEEVGDVSSVSSNNANVSGNMYYEDNSGDEATGMENPSDGDFLGVNTGSSDNTMSECASQNNICNQKKSKQKSSNSKRRRRKKKNNW